MRWKNFRPAKSLLGNEGAFAPMLKELLKTVMEAELNEHVDEEQRAKGNRKMVAP